MADTITLPAEPFPARLKIEHPGETRRQRFGRVTVAVTGDAITALHPDGTELATAQIAQVESWNQGMYLVRTTTDSHWLVNQIAPCGCGGGG